MYSNGFVVGIKINDISVSESGNQVIMPFNKEYSIFLKNRNSRRAVAKVYVDGEEVTKTGSLILNANSSLNLERYIEDNDKGRKFKFVSLSNKEVQDKGDSEKGFIEVRFRLEKIVESPIIVKEEHHHHHHYDHYHYDYTYKNPFTFGPLYGSTSNKFLCNGSSNVTFTANNGEVKPEAMCFASCASVEPGASTKGSESNQKFTYSYMGELETTETVIRFQLVGTRDEKLAKTYNKTHCSKCGKKYNSKDIFCSTCGEKK